MTAVEVPPFVFLGGTCNDTTWRDKLIDLLEVEYFNPVVEEWTEEARKVEDVAKQRATAQLYVITPEAVGFYSIAELTERVIIDPSNTVVAFLDNLDGKSWTEQQLKSNAKIVDLLHRNGGVVSNTLQEVADRINTLLKAPV
jgi:hypothetical protein